MCVFTVSVTKIYCLVVYGCASCELRSYICKSCMVYKNSHGPGCMGIYHQDIEGLRYQQNMHLCQLPSAMQVPAYRSRSSQLLAICVTSVNTGISQIMDSITEQA